jgi:hypothetical protein
MPNVCRLTALLFILSCCYPSLVPAKEVTVDSSAVLKTLDKNHPRLMLKDRDLELLKKQYTTDKALQKCIKDSLEQADACLERRDLTYRKIGPRLLHVSRDCLNRTYALALAYRWTGNRKYAEKAKENLLTVCAFEDWNPSHFLDTAEMSHAVGLGYDWLYSYLDNNTRKKIRAGLVKNGFQPALRAYEKSWWPKSEHNWNQVCNGGMIAGALAVAESEPRYAEKIITLAIESLPRALKSYSPDGAWMEGPGYWSYATHYTAYGLTALQTALGTDFGLLQIKGLAEAGNFPIYTAGPTGRYLSFADCGGKSFRRPMPCMFWLARTYNNPLYAQSEHDQIAKRDARAQHVVWYVPAPDKIQAPKELDYYFRGPVEIALLRSAWDDPQALSIGIKAGYNQVNHGHLDLGNFELDALGVRWACDLGSDNYNLPGYWDKKRGGRRWSYYRLNSKSHNVPLLNGQDQDPLATSRFTRFQTEKSSAFVLVDLTSAYENSAKKVTRGVRMLRGREAVLVQDEFDIQQPCELTWAMTTDAKINIKENDTAILTLGGRKLIARIMSPSTAGFAAESAEQKPPQKTNKGVSRLIVRLPDAQGDVRVAILLSPVWKDKDVVTKVQIKPLAQW